MENFSLVEYLGTELAAIRIHLSHSNEEKLSRIAMEKLDIHDSLLQRLEKICGLLGIEGNCTFDKAIPAIVEKIQILLKSLPTSYIQPLINFEISVTMKEELDKINDRFKGEYKKTRELCLTRFTATAEFLLNSKRVKYSETGREQRAIESLHQAVKNLVVTGADSSFSVEFDVKNARGFLLTRILENISRVVSKTHHPSIAKEYIYEPVAPVEQIFDKKKKKKKTKKQTFSGVEEQNMYSTSSILTKKKKKH